MCDVRAPFIMPFVCVKFMSMWVCLPISLASHTYRPANLKSKIGLFGVKYFALLKTLVVSLQ